MKRRYVFDEGFQRPFVSTVHIPLKPRGAGRDDGKSLFASLFYHGRDIVSHNLWCTSGDYHIEVCGKHFHGIFYLFTQAGSASEYDLLLNDIGCR